MYSMSVSAAALLTAVSAGAALAQADQAQKQGGASDQANAAMAQTDQQDRSAQAQQCRDDLQALGERMRKEGYWLSGWRGGLDAGGATPADVPAGAEPAPGSTAGGMAATAPPPLDGTAATAARQPAVTTEGAVGPWGATGWRTRPSMEIGTLFRAADILAQRGDQQGCETVLNAAKSVYGEYAAQLKELGVDPDAVSGWRQDQIANAQPITQIAASVRADNVVGTDVRNAQDDSLGEVDDIIVDPKSGQVRYAVISEGGFFGIGKDRVLVPWNQLRATPGLETILLPVSEDTLKQAPKYDPRNRQGVPDQKVDQYWSQALGDKAVQQPG
jgi:sporulation protein YlmC with PRC-barrel domain